jgi:hypothetical protein
MAVRTDGRNAFSRIDQTLFVLQAVTTVADAACFIPGLKMAVQLVYNIADMAKVRGFALILPFPASHSLELSESQE